MARRRDDRNRRPGRPDGPLDWLKQPEPPTVADHPEAATPSRPGPVPAAKPEPVTAAPQTVAIGLSRRAARAQREAEQAQARPAQGGPDAPFLTGPPPVRTRGRRGGSPAEPDREPQAPARGPRRRQVAFWLTVAAGLLGLWSATAFIDSGNALIAGLASLSPVVTVLALPVLAVGVASKHLVPTAIAVVAALLPWTLVTGYATAGPGLTTVGSASTLRVMSVDGGQGAASAKDIVFKARLYSANIVVVTELTSQLAHQMTVDGLDVLGTAQWVQVPTNGQNGIGLWSDLQIGDLQPIDELSRPGVDGAIDAGTDKIGITVVQLNGEPLRPSPSWHSDLVRLANRTAPTRPGFIVGDLNAGPWQPAFRKLTGAGWRDAADVVGQGLRPTWPSWSPLPITPLDHVLVSPGIGVSGADTANITGSDHRALIVTLILPHAGG